MVSDRSRVPFGRDLAPDGRYGTRRPGATVRVEGRLMQQPRPLHRLGDLPSAPARARAIALVRPAYWTDAREIAAAVHCDLELTSDQAAFANRIEAGEPDCAVVDSGATTSSEQLLRFARSLWPNAALVLVVPQWSDDEPRLRSVASAVLHAPIRPKEWSLVLDRVLRDRRERLA